MIIYTVFSKHHNRIMYVGQTSQGLSRRKAQHKQAAKTFNNAFYKAIRKYGFDNFIFSKFQQVETDIDAAEIEIVEKFDTFKNGYNESLGGGVQRGYRHSKEAKKKQSDKRKDWWKNNDNRVRAVEHLKTRPPRKQTLEERQKRSVMMTGENNPMAGKHHSKETKQQMSLNRTGENNANAKQWMLVAPNGSREIVTALKKYCEDREVNYLHAYRCYKQNRPIEQVGLRGWHITKL